MDEKDKVKAKWGISVSNYGGFQRWSFGICISHDKPETYLFINFWKWTFSVGKIIKFEDF